MILKKMFLNNFTSFYGKHVFELQEGLNFVVGPSGSGKTNLARAFRFAVLGHTDVPREKLINLAHRRESQNPFCQAEVEIQHKYVDYHIQSELSLIEGKEMRQYLTTSPRIDKVITSETFKHIYLNPLSLELEDEESNSTSTRVTHMVIKHLNLNLKGGIKMAILDGILELLAVDHRGKLLSLIDELAFDQVTIMGSWVPRNLEGHALKIRHVKFDTENFSSKFLKSSTD